MLKRVISILTKLWRSHLSLAALFILGIGLNWAIASCNTPTPTGSASPAASPAAAQAQVVRIGHQKFDPFTLVKARGGLEKRLQPLGISVEWKEFQSGPPMLEALNVGSIDIGRTGDAPPVFAQAANAPLLYIGGSAPKDRSSGILVPANSPIQTLADLRGKKIAFTKGSSANYLLAKALKSAGIKWTEIEPANLTPADARAAFQQGNVDAWVIWDPFYAAAQAQVDVRVVKDSKGLAANRDFYLANRSFTQSNSKIIEAIREETQAVATWADANPEEVVKILAPILKIDVSILDVVTRRRSYGFEPIQADMVAEQQEIADTFFELGLIPKQLKVQEVVWKPGN
ncbi:MULTISPECIES: sulfonate ABC transporter substrate-binding protein [unclassified Microcoleus]|uniref:sulfonate ABC transporter substrate-binding protein n=1 Tax=unclassified Microcoleus TaxID=2642155 RepID=UPI002FD1727F